MSSEIRVMTDAKKKAVGVTITYPHLITKNGMTRDVSDHWMTREEAEDFLQKFQKELHSLG